MCMINCKNKEFIRVKLIPNIMEAIWCFSDVAGVLKSFRFFSIFEFIKLIKLKKAHRKNFQFHGIHKTFSDISCWTLLIFLKHRKRTISRRRKQNYTDNIED